MNHNFEGIKRPVKIQEFRVAVREMSNDELANVRREIENSTAHLNRSNARLRRYISKIGGEKPQRDEFDLDDEDDENLNIDSSDLQLFNDSIRENEIVLDNYREIIEALDQEDIYRATGKPAGGSVADSSDSASKRETPQDIPAVIDL
ncbi:Tma17p KNAG_0A05560 [Huiozyma naganishii CBS 8797]|uniref:Translation machinery-associated protein 17 n=1 Tax=Huiozyma naganishii (strain ATCC MYA-139 / BCRC 22969 / CBS 8797 / KCTC 17520 / NBRC 10181 / NCYC 3082 / Yp74L-3) TaxID=1071383 RepID=J7R094_HUIN7|nr:hypothetical protein KNAG_0A05560 [Kazachstania naganishii CBS 8797]CCK68220.1 hypothetical protein KNAG_0A05560 [Kazachstania naganishii CBS 8797]